MANYRITAGAKADLWRIYNHGLEMYGEAKADEYYNKFFEIFEQIAENPYLYQAVDHINEGYRRNVCGIDNIFYRVIDDTVEIITILGRQDINEIP